MKRFFPQANGALFVLVMLLLVVLAVTNAHAQNPVLNCAADVCCHPQSPQAMVATIKIMTEQLGMSEKEARMYASRMRKQGIVLFPAALAKAIGDFAFDRTP